MNDRDRRAPVTLARNAPVAQTVSDFFLADAFACHIGGDGINSLLIAQAVVFSAVDATTVFLVGIPFLPGVGAISLAVDCNHLLYGQMVFFCECKIAFVMCGHAHHRAIAVAHQYVITDPDIDRLARQWMRDGQAGGHAFLFHRGHIGFDHATLLALGDESGELSVTRCGMGGQRMFGRDCAEGHAHDRVGACGEDPHLAVIDQPTIIALDLVSEREAHTSGFANPVRLHDAHALRPAG